MTIFSPTPPVDLLRRRRTPVEQYVDSFELFDGMQVDFDAEVPEFLLRRRRGVPLGLLSTHDFIAPPTVFVGFDEPPPAFVLRRRRLELFDFSAGMVEQDVPTPLPACPGSVSVTRLGPATVAVTARTELGFSDSSGTVVVTQKGPGSVTVQGKGCIE